MLFPSQVFLLLFLPLTLLAFHGFARGYFARVVLIASASFAFYAWWDPRFVPLLAGTIGINWLIGRAYHAQPRGWLIALGVTFNLGLLGFFKYTNFIAESVLTLAGVSFEPWTIILPLGISFFTFQQVSYLVDLRRGAVAHYDLASFAAYVSFFPQLIAGPIVRHNELIPQFERVLAARPEPECVARGAVLFILGLGKKVFLADEIAPFADAGFAAADSAVPGGLLAWQGVLAYGLQIYFDFSSYSDMAMGLAGLFGFDLPLNFDKPYRSRTIREYWRRWHMTLSRFIRDYLYIPLGGSHGGAARTYVVTLVTMTLCGLWHGAGWTYVLWGSLHGVAVCWNRWWDRHGVRLPVVLAWLLAMVFLQIGWAFFRADDLGMTARMLQGMFMPDDWGRFNDSAWTAIAIGAVLSIAGPSNVEFARGRAILYRGVPALVALLLVAVLMRVGQGRALEFIYFQF
ncbi:MAG: MBOAT family protein [Gammaproteobacteria bacterium]